MATVRATCPDCGDIEADSTLFRLYLCENTREVSYSFRCPKCSKCTASVVVEHMREGVVSSFRSIGVGLKCWTLPRELGEHPQNAPQFTQDDELDFHELLDTIEGCEDIPGWSEFPLS